MLSSEGANTDGQDNNNVCGAVADDVVLMTVIPRKLLYPLVMLRKAWSGQ